MKVLITGFDPFGGESINPAWEAVKAMGDRIGGADLVKLELPTVFDRSIDMLDRAIEEENPDLVVCIGQAGGRFDISIERVAINIDDARIEDNEGRQPIDEPIREDGEAAYFSNLPIKAMAAEVRKEGLPASISNSAGTFVCNHIMYGLLYLIDKKYRHLRGGFIHVPYIAEQVVDKKNMPFISRDDLVRGLEACLRAAVENKEDIRAIGGSIA